VIEELVALPPPRNQLCSHVITSVRLEEVIERSLVAQAKTKKKQKKTRIFRLAGLVSSAF
jgi:hypothetical protein